MRAIIVRAGDFFGAGRGSWLDLVITKDIERQRLTYPGPLDVVHAWAYLPDFADTLVRVAERRQDFPPIERFGFAGHAFTGRELIAAIEAITHGKFNVRRMGWWFLKTFGQVLAIGRELSELEYLWRVPHQIDGSKLAAAIGDVPHTPLPRAMAAALRELGHNV
jgi:nucleoside-diphosphate-sugar epimerase